MMAIKRFKVPDKAWLIYPISDYYSVFGLTKFYRIFAERLLNKKFVFSIFLTFKLLT